MTNPSLLLLDEPMEGLAPVIVEEVAGAIKRMLEDDEMAVIIVEQHAELALKLTQQAILLERGRIVHRAPSADLRKDKVALDRYIGLSIANPSPLI
jgi:branched-chain amino acid transport system ATP-binding protein